MGLPPGLSGVGLKEEADHKMPKEVLITEEGHELGSQPERHLRVFCSVGLCMNAQCV